MSVSESHGNPRVSFVVPNYNYEKYVAQAVDSLLAQDFTALEVIVIDDRSTDSSARVLERYAGDPRVRIVLHAENRGHIRTYNEGLAMARGEFVGLLSADDVALRTDAVSRQVAVFDSDPGVGFVYTPLCFVDDDLKKLEAVHRWREDGVHDGLDEFRDLVLSNFVPASGTLVRTACHLELGFYDERLPHAGDWDLWLRIAARRAVGYVAAEGFGWRIHRQNMHDNSIRPEQANGDHLLTLEKAFDSLPAGAPDDLQRLRGPAFRRLAIAAIEQERKWGRAAAGWSRALAAVRRHPDVLRSREFHVAVAKLAVLSAAGRERVRWLAARRNRQAPVPAATR